MNEKTAVKLGASIKALAIEKIIEASVGDVPKWINVTPAAIATRCRNAIEAAGWTIVPPKDFPGVCHRCLNFIEPDTVHSPFNGNQMFACLISPHRTTVLSPVTRSDHA